MRSVECGIAVEGRLPHGLLYTFRIPHSAFRIRLSRVKLNVSKKKLVISGIIAAPILLFALYTWSALTWSYSEGERAGYVQKFSKKGWICKTGEGELAMVSIPGSMPEKFYFSVRDDSVAAHINASLGKRVALVYEQKKGVPTSCFGETEYFVTDVKVVERTVSAPRARSRSPEA